MKILVTGAGGFIGRNLAESLAPEHSVLAPRRAELDLLDADAVRAYLRLHQFDAVIHAATERSNRLVAAPPSLLHNNCRMFFNLARNGGEFGRMLFLSSGAVYDLRHAAPRMPEEYFDTHVPADDYGFSKYICAQHIRGASGIYELRLFGVFGPYEDWRVRFLSNACCRAVFDLPIAIRQNARFDYLRVEDLGLAVRWFLQAAPAHRAYNVCSGRVFELRALAEMVRAASGKRLEIAVKKPGIDREYSGANSRLVREAPGFRPAPMEQAVAALYRWYVDRKDTIDPAQLHFDE